jgi:hypothetical protein
MSCPSIVKPVLTYPWQTPCNCQQYIFLVGRTNSRQAYQEHPSRRAEVQLQGM